MDQSQNENRNKDENESKYESKYENKDGDGGNDREKGKNYKILYIDDEIAVCELLNFILKREGYTAIEAKTGIEGLKVMREMNPDVILLDLSLPDLTGEEVLAEIRRDRKTPVIILTANDTDDDKVKLLDLGADDYLVKPFHRPELMARIRVAIRHREKSALRSGFNQSSGSGLGLGLEFKQDQGLRNDPHPNSGFELEDAMIFRLGELEIDFAASIVKVKNKEVKLTSTEFKFLKILALNFGKIVTQSYLLKEVWGPNNEKNTHYLRVYALQLRKKIEKPLGKKIFVTESGVGYRIISVDDNE
jgi:two-component system KDP operon response regulator KdpE